MTKDTTINIDGTTLIGGFPRSFFLTRNDDNTLVTTTNDRNEPLLMTLTDAIMQNWSSTATRTMATRTRRRNSAINTLKYWGRNNPHAGTRQTTSDRNKDAAIRRGGAPMKQIYPGPIDRLVWMQQEAGRVHNHTANMSICGSPDKTGAFICHKIRIIVSKARGDIKPTTQTL